MKLHIINNEDTLGWWWRRGGVLADFGRGK